MPQATPSEPPAVWFSSTQSSPGARPYLVTGSAQDHIERRGWGMAAEEARPGPWTRRRRRRVRHVGGAVVGGRAMGDHLTLGHETREHEDLYVLVLRRDGAWVRKEAAGTSRRRPAGSLRPWPVVDLFRAALRRLAGTQ